MKHVYPLFTLRLLTAAVLILYASAVHAQISGTVYRDIDASGSHTINLPAEPGVPNVTVNAYVNFSLLPISVTTNANGGYTFTAEQIPPQAKVRIEFASIEDGFFFGPVGLNSQTNLRFVTAPATEVNCGINYPTDYCQNGEVSIILPCFVNGNPLTTVNATGTVSPENQAASADVLVSFSVDASGLASGTNYPPVHLASAGELGAVWGIAYLRAEKKVLSSATIKRHSGLGPLGTGGIYITDLATATSTPFFDFQADLGISTGADPHSGLNPDKTQPSADPGPMSVLGKSGLGGIDLSDDSKTLYVVNMLDRKLYGVFIDSPARKPSPADVKSWPIDQSGCPNGDFRPWAVYNYRKYVYVGGVCSGENRSSKIGQYGSATEALAATLSDTAGLKAIIMRLDPRQGPAATFQTVLSFPLTFQRGAADLTDNCAEFKYWLPWTNEFPLGCNSTGQFVMWPQPMVTDLAFDDNGDMVIGMLDRFGHLAGVQNHNPNGEGSYNGFTGGDILRASVLNPDRSAYKLESNGSVGGRTAGSNTIPGSGETMSPPYATTTGNFVVSGVGNNQGPGGGEFYFNDQWYFNVAGRVAHDETTNGSLMIRPGSNEVMTSVFDPITDVYQSGGVRIMSNLDGTVKRNYALYGFNTPGSFGKVSGLGDGKILCDLPPIEIGNRVWFDDNRNGVQDAYEPGIDGIALRLFDMSDGSAGIEVGSTTTVNGGLYVFNNGNVPTGLQFNRNYQIRMDVGQLPALDLSVTMPAGGSGRNGRRATTTRDYYLSPQAQGTAPGSITRDSDASIIGSDAVISLTTGDFGQNNYNYDLAVYACPSITTDTEALSVCADAATIPAIPVTGQNFALVDDLRFVYFTSPQSGTAMYEGGTVLATYTPSNPASHVTSLTGAAISTANATGAPLEYYVYGIVYPTPANPDCRVSSLSKLTILPKPTVSVVPTSATLTCSEPTATLAAQDPTPRAIYTWYSPSGSTGTESPTLSVSAPGVYTLTGSLDGCAGDVAMATVTEDKGLGTVSVNNVTLTCSTTVATLTASVDGVPVAYPVFWTGPNDFTSTANPIAVELAGTYTASITLPNGCTITSDPASGIVTQGDLTPPFLDAFGGLKLCPTCSVTLVAEASGVSFSWTGPNNFTSTEQYPVVQDEGQYTVTVTDLESGCTEFLDVVVERLTFDACPVLTIDTPSLTVCSGGQPPAVTVTSSSFGPAQQVQFVQFTSPQSGTAIYTGGTLLSTVTPDPNNRAVLLPGILSAQLAAATTQTLYIYAIVTPAPATMENGSPECWPSTRLTVTVTKPVCPPLGVTRLR